MLKDIQSPAGDASQENCILNVVRPCVADPAGFIKSLPSVYRNVKFRSRLEARWAVFFHTLDINYEYEYEGYDLNGTWYLPDFYLPDWNGGTFVEVKPKRFTEEENKKASSLCMLTGQHVFKAVGSPSLKCYEVYFPAWFQQFKGVDNFYSNFSMYHKSNRQNRFWTDDKNTRLLAENFPELTRAVEAAKNHVF